MSKLSYLFVTLIGAIPAGWALYHLIMTLLNKANSLSTMLLAAVVTLTVCMVLIVLTPFIVAVFYKDTRPKPAPGSKAGAGDDEHAAATGAKAPAGDGFGDAIPEDFDEDELKATAADDEYEDDGEYEDADDGEYEDFDMDEFDDE